MLLPDLQHSLSSSAFAIECFCCVRKLVSREHKKLFRLPPPSCQSASLFTKLSGTKIIKNIHFCWSKIMWKSFSLGSWSLKQNVDIFYMTFWSGAFYHEINSGNVVWHVTLTSIWIFTFANWQIINLITILSTLKSRSVIVVLRNTLF